MIRIESNVDEVLRGLKRFERSIARDLLPGVAEDVAKGVRKRTPDFLQDEGVDARGKGRIRKGITTRRGKRDATIQFNQPHIAKMHTGGNTPPNRPVPLSPAAKSKRPGQAQRKHIDQILSKGGYIADGVVYQKYARREPLAHYRFVQNQRVDPQYDLRDLISKELAENAPRHMRRRLDYALKKSRAPLKRR